MNRKDQTDEKIAQLHDKVKAYLDKGYSRDRILQELQGENLEPYYIETIIENISSEEEDQSSFRNSMIMGGFFIVGGLALNILSYRMSENTGSMSFLLFWGILVTGIVTVIRGFILYR